MRTIADIKKELKAKGVKGITGKKKCELERMLEKHTEKSENDLFFEDAYKKLNKKSPKMNKSVMDMDKFLTLAEKKLQPPKAPTLKKTTKTPEIDKAIKIPKEKITMNLQEKLAKANLRGGVKMKYNV